MIIYDCLLTWISDNILDNSFTSKQNLYLLSTFSRPSLVIIGVQRNLTRIVEHFSMATVSECPKLVSSIVEFLSFHR